MDSSPTAASPDAQSHDQSEAQAEAFALALEANPDYRVLRRVPQRKVGTPKAGVRASARTRSVLILDTETTGLDPATDHIIELALLRVEVDADTGRALRLTDRYVGLEDPGRAIPPFIEQLTGITDLMLTGCLLDEDRIAAMLEGDPLVIAHQARFDRPFVEARLPRFASLSWACSIADIDWKREGIGSCKLDYIAGHMGWFFDAHRAEADCQALLAVLDRPLPRSGRTGFAHLMSAQGRWIVNGDLNEGRDQAAGRPSA